MKTPPDTTVAVWTTIEITTVAPSGGVSLGLILPIVFIGVFLLTVASCLYWHSWRDKRHMRGNVGARSTFSLTRLSSNLTSGTEWTKDYRSSTRSNTPLRTSFKERARIQPLDWAHPADNDAVRPTYTRNIVHCANTHGAMDNPAFQFQQTKRLSPIDEKEMSKQTSSARSELTHGQNTQRRHSEYAHKTHGVDDTHDRFAANLPAQAPFSPYHTTWISGIEPNWERTSSLPNFPSTTEHQVSVYVPKESLINSPYYPNHNTPTEPADLSPNSTPICGMTPKMSVAQIKVSDDVVPSIKRVRHEAKCGREQRDDGSSATKRGRDDGSSVTVYPESGNPSSNSAAVMVLQCSRQSDGCSGHDASSSLSLPSSISQWHQRNLAEKSWSNVKFGVVDVGNGPQNPALASSIDSYTSSDNVSMHPNFGSSNNTSGVPRGPAGQPLTSMTNSTNNSAYRRVPNNTAASSLVFQPPNHRSEDATDGTSSLSNINRSDCLIHGQKGELPSMVKQASSQLRRSISITVQKDGSSPMDGDVHPEVSRSRPVSYPVPYPVHIGVMSDSELSHQLAPSHYMVDPPISHPFHTVGDPGRSRPLSHLAHAADVCDPEVNHFALTQPHYVHHMTAPNLPPLLRHKQYWV